jgi:hypothetical protein
VERASRLAREIDRREAGPFGLGRGGGVNEAEANLWPQEHERGGESPSQKGRIRMRPHWCSEHSESRKHS